MNITVLGCGRWGSFLSWYFNSMGHKVLMWGRETSEKYKSLEEKRQNDYVSLSDEITLSTSLSVALEFSDVILIAIKEQNLRDLMESIICKNYGNKTYVLCMKGLENTTCKRLSEVVYEYVENKAKIAVMVGPAQPTDLVSGSPTCMIIDSNDKALAAKLAKFFSSRLIHYCVGDDMIGNEIGAAINKIIGIAGGVLDELGCPALKGILMVVGTQEIAIIINALGGKSSSAYGLCCLGDYQASLFSEYSNSVAYGKALVRKDMFCKHAPGVYTAQTITDLTRQYKLFVPFLTQISDIILGFVEPNQIVSSLMNYKW